MKGRRTQLGLVEGGALALAALALITVLYERLIIRGRYYDAIDVFLIHVPFRDFISRTLASHQLPLWVPNVWLGAPFAGNGDSALFYPLQVPFLFSPEHGFGWVLWLHTLAALLTVFLFLWRGLDASPPAAAVGAALFALGGYAMMHTGLLSFVYEAPWPPLAFLGVALAVKGRRDGVLLAILGVALSLLAGDPQEMYYCGLWLLPLSIILSWRSGGWRRSWLGPAVVAVAVVGGFLLAAIAVVPQVEDVALGTRAGSGMTFDEATLGALQRISPWNLLLLDYRWRTVGEGGAWVGLVGVALVGLGFLLSLRSRSRAVLAIFWAVMASVCYFLALGPQTPLLRIVFDTVPGMHQFRMPVRWLFPLTLAMVALAATGADDLLDLVERIRVRRALGVAAAGVAGLLAAGVFLVLWRPAGELVRTGIDRDLVVASAVGVLVAVGALALMAADVDSRRLTRYGLALAVIAELGLAAQMAEFNQPSTVDPFSTPTPLAAYVAAHPAGRVLPLTWSPDWATAYRRLDANTVLYDDVSSAVGFGSGWPVGRDKDLQQHVITPLLTGTPISQRVQLLRALDVGYVVATAGQPGLHPVARDGQWVLYALDQGGRRAWASCGARAASTPDQALAAVLDPGFRAGTPVIEGLAGSSSGGACGTTTITRETSQGLTIEASLPRDGWVMLADSWYPGWNASLDGRDTPILHADYFLRAVRVPGGTHRLTFGYQPASVSVGAAVTGLSGIVWLGAAAILWRRRRRGDAQAPPA